MHQDPLFCKTLLLAYPAEWKGCVGESLHLHVGKGAFWFRASGSW